ncbi:MAG: hypothetical protein ACI825_000396 [Planctomycetota bacterium]|jgi:hypothetical protein|uniref:hypothetical protein n=1 Tax=Patiriisocius sp. Uisw_047 TaxID=3230969 RepID=UPI0039E96707
MRLVILSCFLLTFGNIWSQSNYDFCVTQESTEPVPPSFYTNSFDPADVEAFAPVECATIIIIGLQVEGS